MERSEFSSGQSRASRSEGNEKSRLESNRVKASEEKRGRAEWNKKIVDKLFNMDTDRYNRKDRL